MLGLFATIYSLRDMEGETGLTLYYTLLLGLIAGLMGVVFAGDFFSLYVFWEIMCLASYTLVAFRKEGWEPLEAGFKYLIMSVTGASTVLLAMSFLYATTGSLNFAYLAASFSDATPNPFLFLTMILIIVGFGINAAVVPFHTWLPDAHPAAPAPISAMLSGVVIKASVYALCRVLFSVFPLTRFHWGPLLAILSVVSMTIGNITALLQSDIKRLLAYSSIAQIGYILIGMATGSNLGLTGTNFHVFNHALMKGLAFLCAGAFIYRSKTRRLDEMAGIGRKMPLSALILSISLLALAGLPGLNGFMSKLVLFTSAIRGGIAWLAIAGVLNSAFSVAYYVRLIIILIRPQPSEKAAVAKEAPVVMLAPMCAMATFIVLFGVWPEPIQEFAQEAAASLTNLGVFTSAVI
ncbi:MAG: complex I subunit 5 family protein [Candidatus Bathyarchaeia archaeon]